MKSKYNFEIIFNKLEEFKSEQVHLDNSDFNNSKIINDQIRELKESYEDLSNTEIGTFTGT